ncbi:GNAT family N-acetyltransferase [Camelliibacillus cellulosilyticus]|uniref:GNAT family N-acetyltransferase n=1 Tax=Camelliibacillus cellulosilyticus TaxID=2174486 RepID=A0ABV9GSH9_9BACL
MNVYEVPKGAPEGFKRKIAELFVQQISVNDDEASFQRAMDAINMALTPLSTSRIVVAEKDGSLYGFAFLNIGVTLRDGGHYLWLNELYVHNAYRNEGIGKKLLLYIIHMAETAGVKAIELETGINNSVTKHIYNSLGFYEIVSKRYRFTF